MTRWNRLLRRLRPDRLLPGLGRRTVNLYDRAMWRMDGDLNASNLARIEALQNKHAGERCFIMGNGPSLAKMDLTPLRSEYTFGLNRIFLMFDELEFQPSYYVMFTEEIIRQSLDGLARVESLRFLNWRTRSLVPPSVDTVLLLQRYRAHFSRDLTRGVWLGYTVTFVALQIAYYMGFEQVVLIGVDHSFGRSASALELVESQGAERDHFHPDYFPAGFRWRMQDMEGAELGYRMAKDAFEADGRRVYDATVGGQLQVFPKRNFDQLL